MEPTGKAWKIGVPRGGGCSPASMSHSRSSVASRQPVMARRHTTARKGSHGGEWEVSSEAKQQKYIKRGSHWRGVEARRDPIYGQRWLTPGSENIATSCAWVRRSCGPKESAGGALVRELTGSSVVKADGSVFHRLEGENGREKEKHDAVGRGLHSWATRCGVAWLGCWHARHLTPVRVGRPPDMGVRRR
jgi:hypothetical protein